MSAAFAMMAMPMSAVALERTTESNDRASNTAMLRKHAADRADLLVEISALQAKLDSTVRCAGKGKFHTPDKAGADADGCTDIVVTVQ